MKSFVNPEKKIFEQDFRGEKSNWKVLLQVLSPKQTIRRLPQPLFILKPAMNPEI